jgi:hypothetical protein
LLASVTVTLDAVISVTAAALADGALNLHPLAFGHSGAARAARDEDAFGGERIGVDVGVFLLQEETVQLTRRLEVADDDALNGDRGARNRCGRAVALDVVDRGVRVRMGRARRQRHGECRREQ